MNDDIGAIVERELGGTPAEITRVDGGLLHETYELRYDGTEYVLQFSSDADEDRDDALRRGLACYVALQDTEIPVPDVVTERPAEIGGRTYVLVERLPGETGERDISPEKVLNAGKRLAEIHDARSFDTTGWIRTDADGLSVRAFPQGGLARRIRRSTEEDSTVLRAGGLEAVGESVERLVDRSGGALPDDFRPVLCHNDYSPDNVLFRDGDVTGVLDFDRAYAGHDHRDLVKAANGFWMHDPCSDWDVRATLYDGYREVRELESSFERNEPVYRTETLASTVAGLLEMDELSEYEREFYAERLLEAVERV